MAEPAPRERSEASQHFALGLVIFGGALAAYHVAPALQSELRGPMAAPDADDRQRVDEAIIAVSITLGLIGASVHYGSRVLFALLEGRPIPELPE